MSDSAVEQLPLPLPELAEFAPRQPAEPQPQPAAPRWSRHRGARKQCDRCVTGVHQGDEREIRSATLLRRQGDDRRYFCGPHGQLAKSLDAACWPKSRTARKAG